MPELHYQEIVQLYSEKCTGRYFKVRDDDLFSKQGPYVHSKWYLSKLLENIFKYKFTYIYICYKIKA